MFLFRFVRFLSWVTLVNYILSIETHIYIQYTSLNPVEPKTILNFWFIEWILKQLIETIQWV